jgi:hypothetical protein
MLRRAADLSRWLEPLRASFDLAEADELREPSGEIIGWHIRGRRCSS